MSYALPWHTPLLNRFVGLVEQDQLPNAIAVTCPPGWGHDSLLAALALALVEADPERNVEEFAHPDFRWVSPDGAVIKIDQIRRINDFAVQTPQLAPRKVAAILDAHLLNTNAANALLKTLEEPPPNTHLILATPYWGKLLPTIRSRCQRFVMQPDAELAKHWLNEQGVALEPSEWAEFGYAPLSALAVRQDGEVDLKVWLPSLASQSLAAATDEALNGDLVTLLARWYRRILLHLAGQEIANCSAPHASLLAFSDELLSVRRQIESSNAANARLLMERLIVRWVRLPSGRAA